MSVFRKMKATAKKMLNENRVNKIIGKTLKENEVYVLSIIFEEQLFKKGTTGDGAKISSFKPYAPSTIRIKKKKGQPTNRVTLRDTKEAYFRARIKAKKLGVEIDSGVEYFKELEAKYGSESFEWTSDNKRKIAELLLIPAITKENKKLL